MLNTKVRYLIPAMPSNVPNETWRIIRQNHRDVVLQNVEGYKVTVSPEMLVQA